jgi:Leucine-rich repeat (LRR) protein
LKQILAFSRIDNKNLINRNSKSDFDGVLTANKLTEWGYGPSTKNMYINSLGIKTIAPNTFVRYQNLIYLDFSFNEIEEVKVGYFKGLTNLDGFDFRNNKISFIEENSFSELGKLSYLDLGHNKIEYISSNTL